MKQLRSKSLKPSPRSLFETIKSLMKKAGMFRKSKINITLRLSHIDLFLKKAMEKGITDIQLPQFPTMLHSQSKKKSNSRRLDNRTKSLVIMPFKFINPFTGNNILMRRKRNQRPGVLFL